jgi:hypothetical protein
MIEINPLRWASTKPRVAQPHRAAQRTPCSADDEFSGRLAAR